MTLLSKSIERDRPVEKAKKMLVSVVHDGIEVLKRKKKKKEINTQNVIVIEV